MKKKLQLQIAPGFSLPLEVMTQSVAIVAKKRVGKSYTMRKMSEQILEAGQQLVLVDPKGDQWGLRSSANGKKPGYPVLILGGEHGDLPLEKNSGELVAKLVVEEQVSVILDLSIFRKYEIAIFMTDFLENVYRLKAKEIYRTPVTVVIDEADSIAPQNPQKGEERMLGAADDLVRRGGQRGIGVWLVTQRTAVLNKNVLTQSQMLVVLRTIAPQDLKAMQAWIDVHGEPEQRKILMESLPSLPIGDAWFWSPGWPTEEGIFKKVHVSPIETFDSAKTPGIGERRIVPKNLADVDLNALKGQMAATIEKAKADDPKALRAQITQLQADLNKKSSKTPPNEVKIDPKAIERAVAARDKEWEIKMRDVNKEIARMDKMATTIAGILGSKWNGSIPMTAPAAVKIDKEPSEYKTHRAVVPNHKAIFHDAAPIGRVTRVEVNKNNELEVEGFTVSGPQKRILDALAWLETANIVSAPRAQVAVLSEQSPKSSGYTNNLSALKTLNLIDYSSPGMLSITDNGRELASKPERTLNGEDIRTRVEKLVSNPQWRIVQALIEAHPSDLPRDLLAEVSGQSAASSGYTNNLSALKTFGFLDYSRPGFVKAAAILFL